jgi:ATP-dependent helicase/nuclease subunit A
VVQVMTIHKSKGLGFDVVLLPDLEGNSLSTRRREGLAIQRAADRSVEWVMDLPAKLFHENDPVLAAHVAEAEAEAAYEKLCLFYVAMTRAKRALYLITKPVSEKSKSDNFPRLLAETLGTAGAGGDIGVGNWRGAGVYAEGAADWFETSALAVAGEIEQPVAAGIKVLVKAAPVVRHPARTPSGTKAGVVSGAVLFGESTSAAASFGTEVHAALAAVEWGGVTPEVLAAWQAGGWGESVVAEARACLESVEVAEVFACYPNAEVWRERAFEIVLDGAWITGIFDRVVVIRDPTGRAVAATIYDFKTDRLDAGGVEKTVGRYAGQLEIYRQAVARLTGLGVGQIHCALVLTGLCLVVPVNAAGAD